MDRNPVTAECVIDSCIPRDGMGRINRIMSWAEGIDWAPRRPLLSALDTLAEDALVDAGDYVEIEDRMLSLIDEALSRYGYNDRDGRGGRARRPVQRHRGGRRMTKTTRAIVGTAVLGAACGLMLAAAGAAKGATYPPLTCEPDVLCAVLRESAVVGYPHPMTQPELRAIVYRTARAYRATAVTCRAGYWVYEPIVCGVKAPRYRSGNPFRVRVLVWEDGSYRITEIRPARRRS